ncbi:MAG: DUF1036 domain-containing protein, partial [Pseudomonadota bacterium]
MGDLSVRSTASLLSLLAGLGWFGIAKPSFAELRLCNDTDELQSVALGYRGETDWSSRGWWNIEPGGCATVIEGKLTQRYYYYYADSPSGGFRGQRFVFCVSETAFEITGDTDCPDRGYQEEDFREIDTGETETASVLKAWPNSPAVSSEIRLAVSMVTSVAAGVSLTTCVPSPPELSSPP